MQKSLDQLIAAFQGTPTAEDFASLQALYADPATAAALAKNVDASGPFANNEPASAVGGGKAPKKPKVTAQAGDDGTVEEPEDETGDVTAKVLKGDIAADQLGKSVAQIVPPVQEPAAIQSQPLQALHIPAPEALQKGIEALPDGNEILDAVPAMAEVAAVFGELTKSLAQVAQGQIALADHMEGLRKSQRSLDLRLAQIEAEVEQTAPAAAQAPQTAPAVQKAVQAPPAAAAQNPLNAQILKSLIQVQQAQSQRIAELQEAAQASPVSPHPAQAQRGAAFTQPITKSLVITAIKKGIDQGLVTSQEGYQIARLTDYTPEERLVELVQKMAPAALPLLGITQN